MTMLPLLARSVLVFYPLPGIRPGGHDRTLEQGLINHP